uniref:heavy metal translocating P-type ATPase n=1 Tax=Marinobacterium profundum TaxID=1714300 RepID=UPI000836E552|nr:heavy metal translocating P-type ATPase [Marinobacterium profundum]
MNDTKTISTTELCWIVSGMDCAGCAAKIRNALERMPGVGEVRVSIISETLNLQLEESRTSRDKVEASVRKLGYDLTPAAADRAQPDAASQEHACCSADAQPTSGSASASAAHKHGHASAEGKQRWYRTAKGRFVLGTGLLLALAWTTKLAVSDAIAFWAFALATVIGVAPIARRAVAALRAGMPFTIEMLMTVAATGALLIGAAEEASLVVFLFAVGEALEGLAANRARAGIRALTALVPKTARLESDGGIVKVNADSLKVGQVVLVRPGDRIPADGEIIEGTSGIDESPVTGESVPVTKETGDAVFAASINTEGALRIRVTRAAADNTIARIIRLVEEAEASRAPTERFIDRFSRYYMPAIVGVAVLVALVPPLLYGQPWDTWTYRALALLLIGCPCALVISVPASIASALYAGTRRGLLMKGGAVIEAAAKTRWVAFDKTGTLTQGRPAVTDVVALAAGDAEVLRLAAGVEVGSSHPLAEALLAHVETEGIPVPAATGARALAGLGMEAEIEGERVGVGSPRFATQQGAMNTAAESAIAALENAGKTVVVVFRQGAPLGLIALRDEPRPDAAAAITELKSIGVQPLMLTGDNPRTAAAIADQLGLEYRASLMPDDKVAAVRELAAQGPIMMVGDGINDAPALAAAHVGIAMGSGTDVALETADGALLRNDVGDVAIKIRLARTTMTNIRQNVTLALGLKAVFLITTVLGFTGLWIAVLADTGATVLVTLNALRLLRFNPTELPPSMPRKSRTKDAAQRLASHEMR